MSTLTKAYAYKGRAIGGKLVKGKIDAASQSAATARLRSMNISPIDVAEFVPGTGLNTEITFGSLGKQVGLSDLAVMSRQMSTMAASGLSLLRTLSILSEQTENKELAKVLGDVREKVEHGSSLSAAMKAHIGTFPPLMVNLIKAGETGGFLDEALLSVAKNYEKEAQLRATVKSALTYPVAVLIMAFLAVIGMLIFIVPTFKNMFEGLGGELPIPTQILVVLSENMIWIGPALLVIGIASTLWWRANRYKDEVRAVADRLKLKIPVFGDLLKKVAIARFTRNFATMMKAGVPILQSLAIVGETSGNWVIEDALRKVQESVKSGKSVAGPLSQEKVFPAMVVQMIAVGEDSGSLEIMLEKVADFYDNEVKSTTEQLTALIEPIMIGVIGAVIGGMIVALYLPIFNIFQLVK